MEFVVVASVAVGLIAGSFMGPFALWAGVGILFIIALMFFGMWLVAP